MPENSDAALLNRVETRGQREQRALSRAIEAKENGKCGWRNREGHIGQRLTCPITMAHALDGQRGRVDCFHCVHLRREAVLYIARRLCSSLCGMGIFPRPHRRASQGASSSDVT